MVVITNQSGIARKFFKYKDVTNLHNFMNKELRKFSAKIDKFYFCPHHVEGLEKKFKKKFNCRKPNIGNFKKLKKLWNVDMKNTFIIGDQNTDMIFAKNSKIKGYLFKGENLFRFVKKKRI